MKLLVVSDSHGDRDILVDLKQQFAGQIDAWFHCGDSELAADDPLWQTYHVVGGNMDFDTGFKSQQVIAVGQYKVFLAHGHRYQIKQSLTALALAAREVQADFAFFGHSHELGVIENDSTLFLNPGSISQPRGQYQSLGGTFAIVTIADSGDVTVTFHTRDGQVVDDLTQSFEKKA
ncbi:metallophosphoesterase [Furfurilactobacillus siliginis]|uniref:Phosphoesterase n=1 Tax=Furfurilactobacillus siliginis TaxID=348151 RepID=A0A0R2L9N4_9LACO|nr:metallophosphoesterase [Furfurilactobacillus siliginis]KRN95431.1 phosphodiesterase [Furfurilactobacillus siliginis]GEK28202.1 phosphoesterase [Furfurilactobacillus siliginis]